MDKSERSFNILIVEDNEADRYIYRRYLDKADTYVFNLFEADTAAHTLELLAENPVDCILLDYNLPDKNGFEFLALIEKNYPAYSKIPVIILTGVKNKKVADAAIKFRIADYLLKSYLDKELLEKSIISAIKRFSVTEELEKQLELEEAEASDNEVLYRNNSNIRMESLLHVLSHELMTPIAAINVFSQVLLDRAKKYMNEEDLSYLKQISGYCVGLKDYLDDILDITRIDSNNIVLYPKRHEVNDLCHSLYYETKEKASEKSLRLNIKIQENLSDVYIDLDRFNQIMLNIIDNAVKYTKEGSVTIGACANEGDSNYVCFYVQDTGSGIPKQKQKYVFDRLYQIIKGDAGGLGLGLSIAYELTLLHGGSMELQSEEGKGSKFTIKMPISVDDA